MALTYLAYNLKRAVNILGVKEIIKRLKEEVKTLSLLIKKERRDLEHFQKDGKKKKMKEK